MSLDAAIKHGKERRRPYRGSKAVDRSCCNHKSCPFCRGARTYQARKVRQKAESKLVDYFSVECHSYEDGLTRAMMEMSRLTARPRPRRK